MLTNAKWTPGKLAAVAAKAYLGVQVITGIEVGAAVAHSVVALGWHPAHAFAFWSSVGFPLTIIQGWIFSLYVRDPASGYLG